MFECSLIDVEQGQCVSPRPTDAISLENIKRFSIKLEINFCLLRSNQPQGLFVCHFGMPQHLEPKKGDIGHCDVPNAGQALLGGIGGFIEEPPVQARSGGLVPLSLGPRLHSLLVHELQPLQLKAN